MTFPPPYTQYAAPISPTPMLHPYAHVFAPAQRAMRHAVASGYLLDWTASTLNSPRHVLWPSDNNNRPFAATELDLCHRLYEFDRLFCACSALDSPVQGGNRSFKIWVVSGVESDYYGTIAMACRKGKHDCGIWVSLTELGTTPNLQTHIYPLRPFPGPGFSDFDRYKILSRQSPAIPAATPSTSTASTMLYTLPATPSPLRSPPVGRELPSSPMRNSTELDELQQIFGGVFSQVTPSLYSQSYLSDVPPPQSYNPSPTPMPVTQSTYSLPSLSTLLTAKGSSNSRSLSTPPVSPSFPSPLVLPAAPPTPCVPSVPPTPSVPSSNASTPAEPCTPSPPCRFIQPSHRNGYMAARKKRLCSTSRSSSHSPNGLASVESSPKHVSSPAVHYHGPTSQKCNPPASFRHPTTLTEPEKIESEKKRSSIDHTPARNRFFGEVKQLLEPMDIEFCIQRNCEVPALSGEELEHAWYGLLSYTGISADQFWRIFDKCDCGVFLLKSNLKKHLENCPAQSPEISNPSASLPSVLSLTKPLKSLSLPPASNLPELGTDDQLYD